MHAQNDPLWDPNQKPFKNRNKDWVFFPILFILKQEPHVKLSETLYFLQMYYLQSIQFIISML